MPNKLYRVRTLGDIKDVLEKEGDGVLLHRGESHFSSCRLQDHRNSFPECIGIYYVPHFMPKSYEKEDYKTCRYFMVDKKFIYKPVTKLAEWVDTFEKVEATCNGNGFRNHGLNIPVLITGDWTGRTGDQIQYTDRYGYKVGIEVVTMRGEDFKSKFFNFYGYEDDKDHFGFAKEVLV
jgi:hypothetical protein